MCKRRGWCFVNNLSRVVSLLAQHFWDVCLSSATYLSPILRELRIFPILGEGRHLSVLLFDTASLSTSNQPCVRGFIICPGTQQHGNTIGCSLKRRPTTALKKWNLLEIVLPHWKFTVSTLKFNWSQPECLLRTVYVTLDKWCDTYVVIWCTHVCDMYDWRSLSRPWQCRSSSGAGIETSLHQPQLSVGIITIKWMRSSESMSLS